MTTGNLFDVDIPSLTTRVRDAKASEERKEAILSDIAAAYADRLSLARAVAEKLCRIQGECTSDDVRAAMATLHTGIKVGPWMGAIFRDKRFIPTGQWKNSQFISNHSASQRVWRLR